MKKPISLSRSLKFDILFPFDWTICYSHVWQTGWKKLAFETELSHWHCVSQMFLLSSYPCWVGLCPACMHGGRWRRMWETAARTASPSRICSLPARRARSPRPMLRRVHPHTHMSTLLRWLEIVRFWSQGVGDARINSLFGVFLGLSITCFNSA